MVLRLSHQSRPCVLEVFVAILWWSRVQRVFSRVAKGLRDRPCRTLPERNHGVLSEHYRRIRGISWVILRVLTLSGELHGGAIDKTRDTGLGNQVVAGLVSSATRVI